jgi:hypothetical protein
VSRQQLPAPHRSPLAHQKTLQVEVPVLQLSMALLPAELVQQRY